MHTGHSFLGATPTGTTPDTTNANSTVATIGNVLTQGIQLYGQLKLMDTNLKLAQRGLPPITADQVAPQINVGLAPDVKKQILWYSLGAAAGFGVLMYVLRR